MLGESVHTEDKHSFLFQIKHAGHGLGYLKADIIGDKLLILTFLFFTNNGTPEGTKLKKWIGLQKTDKKFFGIDKLNPLILSDIDKHKKLKALVCKAACIAFYF